MRLFLAAAVALSATGLALAEDEITDPAGDPLAVSSEVYTNLCSNTPAVCDSCEECFMVGCVGSVDAQCAGCSNCDECLEYAVCIFGNDDGPGGGGGVEGDGSYTTSFPNAVFKPATHGTPEFKSAFALSLKQSMGVLDANVISVYDDGSVVVEWTGDSSDVGLDDGPTRINAAMLSFAAAHPDYELGEGADTTDTPATASPTDSPTLHDSENCAAGDFYDPQAKECVEVCE